MKPKRYIFKKVLLIGSILYLYFPPLFAQSLASNFGVSSQGDNQQTIKLSSALLELQKQYDVYILFEEKILEPLVVNANKVDTKASIEQNLINLLENSGLHYRKVKKDTYLIILPKDNKKTGALDKLTSGGSSAHKYTVSTLNGNVLLQTVTSNAAANALQVTGKVTDDQGLGLPGVNVIVKGTAVGTTTDVEGMYSLNVPDENGTLVFSYIGYTTQEVPVNNKSVINISLAPDTKSLEEVVVVGYGSVQRKDLTGAIASVGSEQIKDLAVTRVDQALMGKVAGVQVKPVSGAPGAAPQIRIRGIGSVSAGGGPLYVVDGFPTDNILTLNPNDIESMDVLKDASATAIYGSRGANGVVIINTKRGKVGKPTITFDTYYGLQQVSKIPHFMNAREQAQYAYYAVRNRNIDLGYDVSGPEDTWRIKVPPTVFDVLEGSNTTDVNHIKEVLRTAPQKQYQLSATGGNENIRYAVSGEYLNQDGIILNSGFKRYSLRANIDAKMSERLALRLNLNPSFTDQWGHDPSGTGYGYSILGNAASLNPYNPIYDENGNYFIYRALPEVGDFPNPVALAKEIISKRKRMGVIGNINAEYTILDALKLNVLVGGNMFSTRGMEFFPHLPSFLSSSALGTDNSSMIYNWLTEYTLNYTKSFGNHNITGLVGFSSQSERGELNSLSSNRFPNNLLPTLSATSGLITNGSSDIYEWSMVSYLSRLNYNYNSKYYLTASIRTDGSSRFGADRKYGLFPSVALAWRISDENFLQDAPFLSELKLRTSYGETGNNNIGNYEHLATINSIKYPLGNNPAAGFMPGRLPNPSLTWEKQKSVNAGIDASFFNNRLGLTVDHFQSRNTDLLLNVNIPSITGFSTALQNIGEVKNTGWEFVLSTVNFINAFKWSTDFNLSTYRNEVVKLGPKGDPIIGASHITQIGQPIGMFYGLLTDGIFETQAEYDKGPLYGGSSAARTRVGDVKFVDLSGPAGTPDGIIDSYDRTIMGSPYPDFYYGMTNRFSYKNFSLSVSLQGVQGNKVLSEAKRVSMRGEFRVNQLAVLNNFWKSEQEPGDSPRPNDEPTGGVRSISTRFLDDGSYLRINNISLGYLLPDKITQGLRLNAARIYLNATNPFIFTKNLGFNPDVSNSENALTPGVDNNNYPLAKSLMLGLNVSF